MCTSVCVFENHDHLVSSVIFHTLRALLGSILDQRGLKLIWVLVHRHEAASQSPVQHLLSQFGSVYRGNIYQPVYVLENVCCFLFFLHSGSINTHLYAGKQRPHGCQFLGSASLSSVGTLCPWLAPSHHTCMERFQRLDVCLVNLIFLLLSLVSSRVMRTGRRNHLIGPMKKHDKDL